MKSNFEIFEEEMRVLLNSSNKYANTIQYEHEVDVFKEYLGKYELKENVFILTNEQLYNYFVYCKEEISVIDSVSTARVYLSALKAIFKHLYTKKRIDAHLLGYISNDDFWDKISESLESKKSKEIFSQEELKEILIALDKGIYDNSYGELNNTTEKDRYIKSIVVNLIVKISLLIPVKITKLLEIKFSHFDDEFRSIEYNEFKINMPNSVHKDILFAIKDIKRHFGYVHNRDELFFMFLAQPIQDKLVQSDVSLWMSSVFKNLGIKSEKNSNSYPVEKFKKTAIWVLANGGVDVKALSELTGLSIGNITKEIVLDKNNASQKLNSSYSSVYYYNYL